MKLNKVPLVLIFVLLLVLISISGKTSDIEVTLKELCIFSTDIAKVQVISLHTYKEDSTNRIFTDITIDIQETYKGTLFHHDEIIFKTYGGTVDGITTFSPDNPSYSVCEEAILFIGRIRNTYHVVASAQGKYNIIKDEETGTELVRRDRLEYPLTINTDQKFFGIKDKKVREGLSRPINNPEKLKEWGEEIPVTNIISYPLEKFEKLIRLMVELTADNKIR